MYFKSISCWTPLSFYEFCGCCENLPSQWGRIYLSPSQAICQLSLGIRPSYVPIQITLGPQQYSVEIAAC